MSPSVKKFNSGKMAYRNNQNRNRNFAGNYGGGSMGSNRMNLSPWENQNFGGGNMPGQNMNAQVINLANNLLSNLCRNQNPPSLLDLPRGGGGGMGNRNQRGGPMSNRGTGGAGNRRPGFQSRASSGSKPGQKQGAGGITKQNAFDRAKKLLAKNSTSKKKESGKRTEKVESPYADVPNDRFYCHLCKKHMWDAESFENHIKGRNHLMMREGIEESYRIKANMIRQEVKMAEQMKSIEMYRLKSKNRNLDYCTMCDLNFHGHISAHRKSDGHLQLKKFLHPKCNECNKEFPTRIDYDSHLLSPDHLKKAAEKNTKVGDNKLVGLQVITEEEELKDVRPPQKKRKKQAKKAEGEGSAEGGAEVKKEGEEGAEGDEAEQKEGEEAEHKEGEDAADESKEGDELNDTQGEGEEEEVTLPVDPENCILDYQDGDDIPTDVDTRLPKYNWTRPVGTKLISKLDCFECKLCGKFFDNDKTAEVHSRTVTHHRNFLRLINEKSSDTKIAEKRAAAAVAAQERKKRKLEEDEKAAAEGDAEEEGGEEGANAAAGEGGEGELYDPSEATGDGEGEGEGDVEMAENGDGEADGEGEGEEEENGGEGEEEAEEKMEDEPVAEPAKEAEPVKADPPKAEPAKTPVKTPAAPAAAAGDESPAKKAAPARGAPAKGTPRGRGRGRYTRY